MRWREILDWRFWAILLVVASLAYLVHGRVNELDAQSDARAAAGAADRADLRTQLEAQQTINDRQSAALVRANRKLVRAGEAPVVVPTTPTFIEGLDGLPGLAGIDGADGQDGTDGRPGARGQDGSVGAQGPQGEVGPVGPQGVPGMAGPAGPRGEVGPAGPQGSAGQSAFPFNFTFTIPGDGLLEPDVRYRVTCAVDGCTSEQLADGE